MAPTFLSDRRLYVEYEYWKRNFSWSPGQIEAGNIIYHCYWKGSLSVHHDLCLKSLLITQSTPRRVWVWLPPNDLAHNREFIRSFAGVPDVEFKSYVPEYEMKDTPYEGHLRFVKTGGHSRFLWPTRPADIANAFRLLVLWKYGGVYFDMDVLFLKDLRPLCSVEFLYQWSNQEYCNNALLHFLKESHNVRSLMERSLDIGSCRSMHLLRFADLATMNGVHILPVFLFDPTWVCHDTGVQIHEHCEKFGDFFTKEGPVRMETFFPASYTYHWHGRRWHVAIRPDTIAGRLYAEINARFSAVFPSASGQVAS